jgi:septal ring factor EnvC (AmiA/AmiB activator)
MHMAQQTLNGGGKESNTSSTDPPEENPTDSHGYVEYLDVDRLKFIKALAATLDTVQEVEEYIEAEQKRWNRGNVLRILEARKVALEENSNSGPQADERVFGYTSQCASS